MKLGTLVFVVSAVAGVGCARPAPAVPTSTTQITAAEVTVAEDAPRTGKAQHTTALTDDAARRERDEQSTPSKDGRRGERHEGGGFSGYK